MSKPAQGHINWTTGQNTEVQDPGGKKTVGWIADDIPPFEYENWLMWTCDLWDKYLEAITDTHITQIAALQASVISLGAASGVTASNTGHTQLLGTNVQTQLDQTDASLTDIYNALTQGKGADLVGFVMGAPGNWLVAINHTGDALDQLASRMVSVEAAAQNVTFTDKNLADYVLDANDPVDGAGNTGLTSNGTVNPRALSFADLSTKYGEEKIIFEEIKATGKYDANGLQEFTVTTPNKEVRVMFYGDWFDAYIEPGIAFDNTLSTQGEGHFIGTLVGATHLIGSYFTVTGVFDGIAVLNASTTNTGITTDVQVEVDGVNTGNPLNFAWASVAQTRGQLLCHVTHPSLQGLSHDIHTVKFIQNDSSQKGLYINGVSLFHSQRYQMPGKAWVNKSLQSYATKTVVTDPVMGEKGGKILRYIDRADNVIKDAIRDVTVHATTVAGSVGSGATTISVVSAAGITANSLIEISDGPTNMERLRVTSVGGNNITVPSPGTVNSYTNPTVTFYGKIRTASSHANERVKATKHVRSLTNGNMAVTNEFGNIYGATSWIFSDTDEGASRTLTPNGGWAYRSAAGTGGAYHNQFSVYPAGYSVEIAHYFVGTGLDVLLDSGVVSGGGTLNVYIDGVDCGVLSSVGDETKWYKVCSDLPEGQHCVILQIGTVGVINHGIVSFKEYETDYPALYYTLPRGDLLSVRTAKPSYLFAGAYKETFATIQPVRTYVSRGAILVDLIRRCKFFSPSNSWAIGNYTDMMGNSLNQDGGAVTGDYIEFYIFGTGFDMEWEYGNAKGIQQITINGNAASAANFPSMVVQGQGYSSGTGKVDTYDPGTIFAQRVSFANVSATPQLHVVRATITGTKNVGSSNYYFRLKNGVFVHNMPFDSDQPTQVLSGSGFRLLPGALDLRLKSADDDGIPSPNFASCLNWGADVYSGGDPQVNNKMAAKIKTHGFPLRISLGNAWYSNTYGAQIYFHILVDGIHYPGTGDYALAAGLPAWTQFETEVNVPPGIHSIRVGIRCSHPFIIWYNSKLHVEELTPVKKAKGVL